MTQTIKDYRKILQQGCNDFSLAITAGQLDQLQNYLVLFNKWNKAYNLSAVRDPDEMVYRHILDSLSVAAHVNGDSFIDVGTGGGLPGIPLAILFPQKKFTLLDSNGKKTRFLFQVKTELKLNNVSVENSRVEKFQPAELFDGVISRAFASLKDMTDGCRHLLVEGGSFWAMKGLYPQDELSQMAKHYKVVNSIELQVPGTDGQRHLIELVQ